MTGLRNTFVTGAIALSLVLVTAAASADTWVETSPADAGPVARVGLVGDAYDAVNDRLILFGGGDADGLPRPQDTWVLKNATDIGGAAVWEEVTTSGGPPLGRYNHTSVYAPGSNSLIVYGGCGGNCSPALGDTWVLSGANGLGVSSTWGQLATVDGDAREGQAAVYDDTNNRMVVFGGQNAFNSYPAPQVRVLSNADGTEAGSPTWTTLVPTGTPPSSRESSGAVYDAANNRMIVFGGATFACCAIVTDVYNDVWVLTKANGLGGTPAWTQLAPTGTPPPPRYHASAVYDAANNRLVVFGGLNNDDPDPVEYSDVWVLTNANGLGGTPEWIQLLPDGGSPSTRWGHAAGYNATYDAMVVAMGRTDGTLLDDTWVLEDANGLSYAFTGFLSPVNNAPTLNRVKSGAAVPVKFSLTGDQGLDVFVTGFPRSRRIACDTSVPVDGIETTTTAGSSSLTYDATSDTYTYVWKTSKAWSGTCRRLEVRLDDGTSHTANFMLK